MKGYCKNPKQIPIEYLLTISILYVTLPKKTPINNILNQNIKILICTNIVTSLIGECFHLKYGK